MNIFRRLKLQFRPPKLSDPDFGQLLFMYISNYPERSYWECEWLFPPTNTVISIGLPGDESGPLPESRQWHLDLIPRFPSILELAKPKLEDVFESQLNKTLPANIFTAVKLAGFAVEDPRANPVEWDIAFETIGENWLGITIPFIGDEPQDPEIDTDRSSYAAPE